MKSLSLEKLNLLLSNLLNPNQKELTFIKRENIHLGVSDNSYGEGVQGESDVYAKIYKVNSEDGVYIKVEYRTDSYGDNDSVQGVTFVQPVKKSVTSFEPIK